jgi:hypothetical protein
MAVEGVEGVSISALIPPPLPARIRNPNFAFDTALWLVATGILLVVTITIDPTLRWVAALLLLAGATATAFYYLSWRRADLLVSRGGVELGGMFRRHSFTWVKIDHFAIREPSRRTPLMLTFRPWADQAELTLVAGSTLRVRALQPWHGVTAFIYFTISRPTKQDHIVKWLNELRRTSTRHGSGVGGIGIPGGARY